MSRPSYSVTVEVNMIREWDIREQINSQHDDGKYRSLLTATNAARARLEKGLRQGERVAIRDSRYECMHGFHQGYIGRVYKDTYKVLTDTGALL